MKHIWRNLSVILTALLATQLVNAKPTSAKANAAKYSCGEKRYCKEMDSCEEAMYHFKQCGQKKLDRDDDGIPCENVCADG